MGSVIGYNSVEEPAFRLLMKTSRYEIRAVPSAVAAVCRVKMSADGNGKAFPVLAKYIGVMGSPANVDGSAIAMTAPVVQKPISIAMTSPVLESGYGSGMRKRLPQVCACYNLGMLCQVIWP